MSERDLRKQILRERVQANRQMLQLEVDGVRAKFDTARGLISAGGALLQPLGVAAASAAGAVGKNKARAGGVAGLAALVPVVLAVAKLVTAWSQAKRPAPADADGPADTEAAGSGAARSDAAGSDAPASEPSPD